MSKNPEGTATAATSIESVDWTNRAAVVIDGFTVADIERFSMDSVVSARCSECGDEVEIEPDAHDLDCEGCDAKGSVTSPLIKLGLI